MLSALNKLAGHELLHSLGLHAPAQRVAYLATRESFRAAGSLTRRFHRARKLIQPVRLSERKSADDLFDLSLSDEQRMMREQFQRFAKDMRTMAPEADEKRTAPDGFSKQLAEL